MNILNFSWVVNCKLAGHAGPKSEDDVFWLKKQGIKVCVRMAEAGSTAITSSDIIQAGLVADYRLPVKDFTAPSSVQINSMIDAINKHLSKGEAVGVSCGAGLGRTGTVLACCLVSTGMNDKEAIKLVRQKRPGSIETEKQEAAVTNYMNDLELQKKWPKTVEQAIDWLLLAMTEEDKAKITSLESQDDMVLYHHGLGTWVRNNFGLWKGNEELIKNCGGHKHPDDASMFILFELWKRLKAAPK